MPKLLYYGQHAKRATVHFLNTQVPAVMVVEPYMQPIKMQGAHVQLPSELLLRVGA
jgi:hypothetical protein